jgi:hypothetical protein
MAQNQWPYLLRVLLKAGWSVEGLAHAADRDEDRVRMYLSGKAIPEPVTAAIYRRILNNHKRRDGLRVELSSHVIPIVSVNEIPEGAPAPLARGVFEDPSVPAGYRQFRAIADDGTELVCLRFHWRAEERDVVPGLRAWLNRADPIIRLLETDASSNQPPSS